MDARTSIRPPWRMPAPRDIEVLGHRLRYWDEGAGDPIVLVHGFSGSAAFEWGRVYDLLTPAHRVIALQVVGFAPSERPDVAYSTNTLLEHLGGFMRSLGLSEITLVGESFGGWHVAEYAVRAAELGLPPIARLALVGAAVCVRDPVRPDAKGVIDPDAEAECAAYLAAAPIPDHDPVRAAIMRESRLGKGSPTEVELAALTTPTLLLWGDRDELIPLACGERAAALIPNSRLEVLAGVGHIPSVEAPRDFARIVSGFAAGSA